MTRGSIAFAQGVLFLCRSGAAATVVPHDLDGRPLGRGFTIPGLGGRRAEISGLACDVDRKLWIADSGSCALRAFNVFGREVFQWHTPDAPERDRAAHLGRPVGVAVGGVEAETRLLVSSAGERRHALHWVDPIARVTLSMRPLGDPDGQFRRLAGVALAGSLAYACEAGAQRVQVFREGEFHHAFGCPTAPGLGDRFEPRAIAILPDGQLVVAQSGDASALLLFQASGRFSRVLVGTRFEPGSVFDPTAIAVAAQAAGTDTRIYVLDQAGERLQCFDLEGNLLLGEPDPALADR